MNVEEFTQVAKLDGQLRAVKKERLMKPGKALSDWRDTRQPQATAWWWFLDERAARGAFDRNPLVMLFSILCIVAALTLWIDTTSRLMGSSTDRIKVFGILIQALFALVAGSTFTQWGRNILEDLFSRLGMRRQLNRLGSLVLALSILLLTVGLWLLIPRFAAVFYSLDAAYLKRTGLTLLAVEKYQRAIALNPKYSHTYYYLGECYEDIHDYDKAIAEYQKGIVNEKDGDLTGFNNLAHLLITQRKEYVNALSVLEGAKGGFPQVTQKSDEYHTNRGWALLRAGGHVEEAEAELRAALALNEWGPAPNCVLAQLLEESLKLDQARKQWGMCWYIIANSSPGDRGIEPGWRDLSWEHHLPPQPTKPNAQPKGK